MDREAQQDLRELVQLKLAHSQPEGVVVFSAEFSGDQSLAARQALIKILQLQRAKQPVPKPGFELNLSDKINSSTKELYKHQSEQDPRQDFNHSKLPKLDESRFPYRLTSGELVSFSHSRARVLVAIASPKYTKLGVDTELKPVNQKLAERFFTKSELQVLKSAQDRQGVTSPELLRQTAWMIKEAHGKAAGLSLFTAIASDLSPVLTEALSGLDQPHHSAHGGWTATHGGLSFAGNWCDHWALCIE